MALATLSIDLTAKTAQLERDMREAADIGRKGTQQIQDSLEGLKSYASGFLLSMAGGMAAAFMGGAVRDWINNATDAADELNRLSQQTGVSVETLSAWGNVAKRNGQDVNDLSELVQELSLKLAETDKDTEGAGLALKQLGMDYKELNKLSPEDAFKKVAEAVAGVEDSGKKTAMVMAILGDEGQKYVSTLNTIGSAAQLEATITAEQAAAASRYKDTLAELGAAGETWSQTVVSGITPALDEAARALTDVIGGTGGLTAEARTLSRDGTIADWARNAVTGLTYLMDAASLSARQIKSVGLIIGATMANAGAGIAAVGEAASLAAEGNFSGALDALKSYGRQVKSIDGDLEADLRDTWGQTLGSQIRERMDQMRAAGVETTKAIETAKKSSKAFTLVKQDDAAAKKKAEEAKKLAEAQKKALEEYEKLVTGIRTKTAADEAEAAGLAPLTEAQRSALEVMTQIRDGRLKLTDTQKVNVTSYLEEALAAEKAAEAAKAYAAWMDESRSANADTLDQAIQQTAGIRDQIAALELQAEEYGLSAAALGELSRHRQLDTARALEARAAAMDGLDSHAELTAEWRRQADAIRELAQRRQELAAMEQRDAADPMRGAAKGVRDYMDELRQAGKAAEDFSGRSLRGIEDALVSVATGGKASWKGLVDSMLAEAARLKVVRPLMQSLLGDGSSAANILGDLAGGSRGGMDSTNAWEYDAGFKSSGTSWLSTAASFVGSIFGGGRANGGGVGAGMLYDINERGLPEVLTIGNRTMLMMGAEGGRVTPLDNLQPLSGSSGAGASAPVIHQTFHFGAADTVTRAEMQRAAADAKNAALAEWANARSRGVRAYS